MKYLAYLTAALLIPAIWYFIPWGYWYDIAANGITNPQAKLLATYSGAEKRQDEKMVQALQRLEKDAPLESPLSADGKRSGDPQKVFHERYIDSAEISHGLSVERQRLQATAKGELVPRYATTTIKASNSEWQTVLTDQGVPAKFIEGDEICVSGGVQNRYYTEHGIMIRIGPHGIKETDIRSYTAYDCEFPLMSLMYQFDNNINTRGVFDSNGCAKPSSMGQKFQMMVNVPYHDPGGFETSSMATIHNFGNWAVTRIGHSPSITQH